MINLEGACTHTTYIMLGRGLRTKKSRKRCSSNLVPQDRFPRCVRARMCLCGCNEVDEGDKVEEVDEVNEVDKVDDFDAVNGIGDVDEVDKFYEVNEVGEVESWSTRQTRTTT